MTSGLRRRSRFDEQRLAPGLGARLARWLPLVSLIVPQSTIERTWIPEIGFVALCAGLLATRTIRVAVVPERKSPYVISVQVWAFLAYFCFVSPAYAYFNDASPLVIVTSVAPFALWGLPLLYKASSFRSADLEVVMYAFIASGVVVATAVMWVAVESGGVSSTLRATGTVNRTLSLPVLPMAAVAAYALYLTHPRRKVRTFAGIECLACCVGVALGVTRGMLLGVVCGGLTVVAVHLRRKQLWGGSIATYIVSGAAGAAALSVSSTFVTAWTDRFAMHEEGNLSTVLFRLDEIRAYLNGFVASPIVGLGLGHKFSAPSRFNLMLNYGVTNVHNHFAYIAGCTGVVGLYLYYSLLWRTLKTMGGWALHGAGKPESCSLALAFGAAALTGLVFTFSSTTFTTIGYNIFLGSMIFFASGRGPDG